MIYYFYLIVIVLAEIHAIQTVCRKSRVNTSM